MAMTAPDNSQNKSKLSQFWSEGRIQRPIMNRSRVASNKADTDGGKRALLGLLLRRVRTLLPSVSALIGFYDVPY